MHGDVRYDPGHSRLARRALTSRPPRQPAPPAAEPETPVRPSRRGAREAGLALDRGLDRPWASCCGCMFPMTAAVLLPAVLHRATGLVLGRRGGASHGTRPSPTTSVLLVAAGLSPHQRIVVAQPGHRRSGRSCSSSSWWRHCISCSARCRIWTSRRCSAMAVGALAGLAVGAAFLCLEVFSDQSLRRFLIRLVPALQPNPHHIDMEGGQLARLRRICPTPILPCSPLMFWPAALLVSRLGLRRGSEMGRAGRLPPSRRHRVRLRARQLPDRACWRRRGIRPVPAAAEACHDRPRLRAGWRQICGRAGRLGSCMAPAPIARPGCRRARGTAS